MAKKKAGAKVIIDKRAEKKLIDDITKYEREYTKYYLQVGRNRIKKKADEIIRDFYNDYDPYYYKRTYQQRDMSIQPFYGKSPFTSDGTDDRNSQYVSGVNITSENVSYERVRLSDGGIAKSRNIKYTVNGKEKDVNFLITHQVWMLGLHGIKGYTKTSPDPYTQLVFSTIYDTAFMQKLKDDSTQHARKQNYNMLVFN